MSMIKYVKKHMGALTEDINSNSNSIASDHLFQIREESKAVVLPEEQAVEFHHTVAQIFVSERDIRYIQISVEFLTTRVKNPDEDDWGNLKRVFKYLKVTRHMKLTLTVHYMSMVR